MARKKESKKMNLNIWDFIDVDALNEALDNAVMKELPDGVIGPVDIAYRFNSITKGGRVKLVAYYYVE